MKTARFADIVKAAGKPQAYTLWMEPKRDRDFQAALKQHRVMSVHQETVGSTADFGEVGYAGDPKAQILVFPKSVAAFRGRKIIGLKYDQVEQPDAAPARKAAKPPRKKEKPAPEVETREGRAKREPKVVAKPATPNPNLLVEGIHRAMRLLDEGKTVAAYRALERLIARDQPATR